MEIPTLSFEPAHDRLFVIREETQTKTKGGLRIPETDKEKPNKGLVIAVGPKCDFAFVGQHIVFSKHHGFEVEIEGREYTILRDGDIYAGDERP